MLFSHLSGKNPTRRHVVLSISAIPRADHKANIIAPSILSMEFIYLTSNLYCVTVGKKYSYVKTVFLVNTTSEISISHLTRIFTNDLIKWIDTVKWMDKLVTAESSSFQFLFHLYYSIRKFNKFIIAKLLDTLPRNRSLSILPQGGPGRAVSF